MTGGTTRSRPAGRWRLLRRLRLCGGLTLLGLASTGCAGLLPGAGGYVGYEYQSFDITHRHATHPDDASFLFGPAGTTEIDDVHFVSAGLRVTREKPFELPLEIGAEIGALIAVSGTRDNPRNANDPRPEGPHAEIYSELTQMAPRFSFELMWRLLDGRLGLGADAAWQIVWVEHGWDRFASDDESADDRIGLWSVGPKIRYRLYEGAFLECGFRFGLDDELGRTVHVGFVFRAVP
jgi:hypothetical protein